MGIRALRKIQLGKESVAGTAVAATALWRGVGAIEDRQSLVFAPEDTGILTGRDRTYIAHYDAGLQMGDTPATFEQLPYILMAGVNDISVAGGGVVADSAVYTMTFNFPTTAQNTPQTFTVEGGDDNQKEEFAYGFVTEWRLSGRPREALMMSATWMGRQVNVVDYTAAGTTVTFTATPNEIVDSANGLAPFLTGTTIKVTGTVSNNSIFTVATGGVAGTIVTTEAPVVEAGGVAATIQDWFAGGPTGLTPPTVEEILFGKGNLYIDAVGGSFGGTVQSSTLLGMDFRCTSGFTPVESADGNAYFASIKQTNPEYLLDLTYEHNGNARTEKAAWRAQTPRRIQLKWTGSAVSGSAYTVKTLILNLVGKYESFSTLDEMNGNDIIRATFRGRYNATAATLGQIIVGGYAAADVT